MHGVQEIQEKIRKVKGTYFGRIRGGKLVEMHSYPDLAGLMAQLGLMAARQEGSAR